MTFADLKSQVKDTLWPDGIPENLVGSIDRFFIKCLNDLQDAVACYRNGNTSVYPHCSGFFNCGMTVIPAPPGQILSIYTIGKLNSGGSTPDGTALDLADVPDASLSVLVNGVPTVAPAVTTVLGQVSDDGLYTVTVTQKSPSSAFFPANSPQYIRTEILYTDPDGNNQAVQPADLLHPNVASNSGAVVINVKAATDISCRTTPFNSPLTDGAFQITVSMVKGSGVNNDDWCKKVYYHQVEYCHLDRYARVCSSSGSKIFQVADAILSNIFGPCGFKPKRCYPAPTDAGYEFLPSLSQGYHYPQPSTDAGGRSPRGVYAIHRGKIFIAPWIETTESVVIEWNGKKIIWNDADLVEDSPKFLEAVENYVGREFYKHYGEDPKRQADYASGYALNVRELINECRKLQESADCSEAGISASAARGIGNPNTVGTLFYNEAQSYTASCPSGQTGQSVTSTLAAGLISSPLSVADANARALAQVTADAQSKLSCEDSAGLFLSVAQTYTASCPAASGETPGAVGESVTVNVPAGAFKSTVSQELADAAALASATSQANAQLVCTFYNAPQSFTATCPDGTAGDSVTVEIAASQYNSTVSQQDADSQALNAAQAQANAQLVCTGITFLVFNTLQTAHISGSLTPPGCTRVFTYDITVTIPAQTFSQLATAATQAIIQATLNLQAQQAANQNAQIELSQQKSQFIRTFCSQLGGLP